MYLPLPSKLVISGLTEDEHRLFLHTADVLELDRAGLLRFLMVGHGVQPGGMKAFIPDNEHREEWRGAIIARIFEFINVE